MIRTFALLICMTASTLAGENTLSRTAARLHKDRQLTIGYLGGSLTSGSGASDSEKTSWRAKTTQWFRDKFPEAKIEAVNAAIGGTGSDLGAYRVGMDLLEKNPDLVFVEFAVNDDRMAQGNRDSVIPTMEGIVRQIWRVNPKADIVFVFTTMERWESYHREGQPPPSVEAHRRVAAHYGIPTVDIGAAVWEAIAEGRHTWEEIMPDKVHPRDVGYEIYSARMREFLAAQDWTATSADSVTLPEKLHAGALENARFVDFRAADGPGWKVQKRAVAFRPDCLASNTPGDELTFAFKGDAIGLFWLSADDAGDIEWSVDGAPFQRTSSWSPHGGEKGRGFPRMLKNPGSLKNGDHVLKLRVAAEKNEKATGHWIRIAAFMVNEP
jgi:acyl-CoA thioesterase-1